MIAKQLNVMGGHSTRLVQQLAGALEALPVPSGVKTAALCQADRQAEQSGDRNIFKESVESLAIRGTKALRLAAEH